MIVAQDADMNFGDSYTNTYETGYELHLYNAHATTGRLSGGSLESLTYGGEVISAGENGQEDECGAWLMGVHEYKGRIIGYYHGESNCTYVNGKTTAAIFWAESFDGGKTFQRPNEDNVLLRGKDFTFPNLQTGVGNFGTYKKDNEIHFTFQEFVNGAKTVFAKTENVHNNILVFDGDSYIDPNSVYEYTSFSPTQTVNSPAFYKNNLVGAVGSTKGIAFNEFDSDFNVTKTSTLVPHDGNWSDRSLGDLTAYGSIVALDGGKHFENSFYLYYSYAKKDKRFSDDDRLVLRRKVRVHPTLENNNLIQLRQYLKDNDSWATTKLPDPGYEFKRELGFIATDLQPGLTALYEAFGTWAQTHRLMTVKTDTDAVNHVRIAGYISKNKTEVYNTALVENWAPNVTNMWYELVENPTNQNVIGWVHTKSY